METCKLCLKPEKFCTCIDAHTKHGKHNEWPNAHPEYKNAPVAAPVAAPVEVSVKEEVPAKPAEDTISGSGNTPWADEKDAAEKKVEEFRQKHRGHHKSKR